MQVVEKSIYMFSGGLSEIRNKMKLQLPVYYRIRLTSEINNSLINESQCWGADLPTLVDQINEALKRDNVILTNYFLAD